MKNPIISKMTSTISYLTARENNQVLRFSTDRSSLTGLAQLAPEWVGLFSRIIHSPEIGYDLLGKDQ